MPNGAFLYADELLGALANKSAAGGFRDMVLYIEACESGSIFEARPALPRCYINMARWECLACRLAEWACALLAPFNWPCAWTVNLQQSRCRAGQLLSRRWE